MLNWGSYKSVLAVQWDIFEGQCWDTCMFNQSKIFFTNIVDLFISIFGLFLGKIVSEFMKWWLVCLLTCC